MQLAGIISDVRTIHEIFACCYNGMHLYREHCLYYLLREAKVCPYSVLIFPLYKYEHSTICVIPEYV